MLRSEEWGISLKLDFRGLRFGIWIYYVLFALGILALLSILQMVMIRPYYRNNKIMVMREVADVIQSSILDPSFVTEANVEIAFQASVNNNACTIIYNEEGKIIYSADSLGAGCIFNQGMMLTGTQYNALVRENSLFYLFDSTQNEISELIINERSGQEMVLYGRKITGNLGNYYLYINSPIELLESTYQIFQTQFVVLTIAVLILSLIISVFFSERLAKPIVKMRETARELANGGYNIRFDGGDFTETKDLASSLNDATDKLSKVDELRKDLIANVSHDIKTPLTMVRAYAEMVRDISGDNKEKREEHLAVIIQEAQYLDELVLELSELAKMQSGNYELNISQFDLADKVREITMLCRGLFEQHNIHYDLVTPESVLVSADETKIGQVIYNFINNAIKYSEDHTNVFIVCQDFGDTVRVSIQDEGSGISEKDMDYIWDRYYKIDKSFKRSSKGTGLGLAIVKAILDSHGAVFGVKSEEGKGSYFWFELSKEDAK